MNSRDRVLAHIQGKPVDQFPLMPVTMMIAADQINVPYRKYATDFRTLVEGQIAMAETFDFDHVSCISDPAREASDLGATVEFFDDQPPAIDECQALLLDKSTLKQLKIPDLHHAERMSDRIEAAALFKQRVGEDKLIEGWVEGPCAEAADLRGINNLMLDFYDDPVFVKDLFEFVVEMELRFARAQVDAGVDIIGIGDAAASLVGPQFYSEFILPYEKKLVDGIHAMGVHVRLHICGNTRHIVHGMGQLGCAIVDLDSLSPLSGAREVMPESQILLGNVNPVTAVRDGNPESIKRDLSECQTQAGARYIIGAGCEIPRNTPKENIKALSDFAKNSDRQVPDAPS